MFDWRWHLRTMSVRAAVWLLKSTGWYGGYWNHWRTMFDYAEQRGLHILPVHYYSPVPDTRTLSAQRWSEPRLLPGVALNTDEALTWLETFMPKYWQECRSLATEPGPDPHQYHLDNSAYGRGDADILYGILRDTKPRKIIEIGSGYSTLLISQAIRANRQERSDYQCEFVAIEPYPPPYIEPPPAEVTRLERKFLQDVPLQEFAALQANDVLFIDSSHVVKTGGDVVYEYLAILASLAPGVLVHIHDVFTPFEYPREWIEEGRLFWNEQYLLEAFLCHNQHFEVVAPLYAISRTYPDRLKEIIPHYDSNRHRTGAFWMRRRQSTPAPANRFQDHARG
jgi:hypothetical protein